MSIVPHLWMNKFEIDQLTEDTIIAGTLIPKGWVNATQMCKANKKRLQNYFDNKSTKAFIAELSTVNSDRSERQIIIIQGGDRKDIQGTWVSLPVAMDLARWISPKFAAWAMVTLSLVVQGDFQALTLEAAQAQKQLRETWEQVRTTGIITRRRLTDSIKDWYACHPNGTSRPPHVMYAQVTNLIYQALWKVDALQMEAILGCGRHQSRDYLSAEALAVLERAEDRVIEFIDMDDLVPTDAVKAAHIRLSRIPLV